MGFGDAVRTCFSKYADFSGRAARPEFWYFFLFIVIIDVAFWLLLFVVAMLAGPSGNTAMALVSLVISVLWLVVTLALLVPQLAVLARRLHDTDKSALWILLAFIPFGSLVLLFFCIQEGDSGTNLYGPPPGQGGWDPSMPFDPNMPAGAPGAPGVPGGPGVPEGDPVAANGAPQAVSSENAATPQVFHRPAGLPVMPNPPRLPAPRTPVTEQLAQQQAATQPSADPGS
ncbi:MAG: DUF805 domain-containing protein [Actinobacteria bacterium]|nr:DUF805 domain-containing protein [Actinomycetota bacterium]